MPEIRLGDLVDDYCNRCKLLTNHAVVSLVNGEPVKVHCRTCFYEHNYHQGKAPEKARSARKAKLFNEVLASIAGPAEEPKQQEAAGPEPKE